MSMSESLATWLVASLEVEEDLRPPLSIARETKRLDRIAKVVHTRVEEVVGYAELRRVGRGIELATVVIDPEHRGKGHAHQLVHDAWDRWRQDPVLHGAELGAQVLVAGPLISFTRAPAMAAALTGGGFQIVAPRRRWSRLWLWRSDIATLPLGVQSALFLDRLVRVLALLRHRPSRLAHHWRHRADYRLFVRPAASANNPPPRTLAAREEASITPVDLVASLAPKPISPAAWDEE